MWPVAKNRTWLIGPLYEADGTPLVANLLTRLKVRIYNQAGVKVYAKEEGVEAPDISTVVPTLAALADGAGRWKLTLAANSGGGFWAYYLTSAALGIGVQDCWEVATGTPQVPDDSTPGLLSLAELRGRLRADLKDQTVPYIFQDTELNDLIRTAIRAYSRKLPREARVSISLQAGQDAYAVPADLRAVYSLRIGTVDVSIREVFAGQMLLTTAPTAGSTATLRCLTSHALPMDDAACSTYDPIDEPVILRLAAAEALEVLAREGARFFRWKEGVQEEDRGKTQATLRAEADRLRAEADRDMAGSVQARQDSKPSTGTLPMAIVMPRKADPVSTTIYRQV